MNGHSSASSNVGRTFAHLVRVWFHLIPVFCQIPTGHCSEGFVLDGRQNTVQPAGGTQREAFIVEAHLVMSEWM